MRGRAIRLKSNFFTVKPHKERHFRELLPGSFAWPHPSFPNASKLRADRRVQMILLPPDAAALPANTATHSVTTPSTATEYTAAVASCQGALRALLDALRNQHGVTGLGYQRAGSLITGEDQDYFWRTLQQAHDYCSIILREHSSGDVTNNADATVTLTLLLLGCWQAVGRYAALEHKSAWMEYQQVRHFHQPILLQHSRSTKNMFELQRTVQQLAERCSTCQRHVLILERRQRRSWRER